MMGNLRRSLMAKRSWLIKWLYLVALGHLIMGLLMTWGADTPLLASYHQSVLTAFGFSSDEGQVRDLHVWWVALFGATLQAFALFMCALIYIGGRYAHPAIWCWLIVAIIVWAPQDIFISLQKGIWLHAWVDVLATCVILLPLISLWVTDRKRNHENCE